jgi:hypothetical protein
MVVRGRTRRCLLEKTGKRTLWQYGDVTFTDPIGQPPIDFFLFELKRGYSKDISVLDFIDKTGKPPILIKWWDKAEGEREDAGRKETLIIFRRNRRKTCVMIRLHFFADLMGFCGNYHGDRLAYVTHAKGKDNKVILDYKGFFDWFSPATLEVL